jgi:putative transposase
MLGFKCFFATANLIAGVELMHMICKGRFVIDGGASISFADRFIALALQFRRA